MINKGCPGINDEYKGSSKINMIKKGVLGYIINKGCPGINDK